MKESVLPKELFYKIEKLLNGFLTLLLFRGSDEFIKSRAVANVPVFKLPTSFENRIIHPGKL